MAIHEITQDGYITWRCHAPERHPGKPEMLRAHVSHEEIQYTEDGLVKLPPCPHCLEMGIHSQTAVMVHFPPHVRATVAPELDEEGNPIGENPAIAKHEQLAQHLARIGKTIPEPQPAIEQTPVFTQAQVEELVTQILREHGIIQQNS